MIRGERPRQAPDFSGVRGCPLFYIAVMAVTRKILSPGLHRCRNLTDAPLLRKMEKSGFILMPILQSGRIFAASPISPMSRVYAVSAMMTDSVIVSSISSALFRANNISVPRKDPLRAPALLLPRSRRPLRGLHRKQRSTLESGLHFIEYRKVCLRKIRF